MIDEVKIRFGDVIFVQRLNFDISKSMSSFEEEPSNVDEHSQFGKEQSLYLKLDGYVH